MTDLEDRILKKNIPGKYSLWDEDYKEDRVDDDDDDSGVKEEHSQDNAQPTTTTSALPSSGKSGVKGVLADYQLHQEEKKRLEWIDQMEKEEILERNTMGVRLQPGEISISLRAMEERKRREKQSRELCEEDDGDGDDDDEFLARYHQQRLRELQQANALPEFGGVEEVDPIGYSKAVDETDPRVVVVVHLYETYIPACRSLMPIMENLSRGSMKDVRFLSLKAASASQTLDPVALPSILIHKAGQLIGNLTPITNHLPENFTPHHVQELLNESAGTRNIKNLVKSTVRIGPGYDNDSDLELDDFCKDFKRGP